MLSFGLERGTSPVDWCESNYTFTPFIAEFINTFSNILFVILPPLLIKLSKQYAYHVNRGIYIIWILYAVIGLSSAYFHATLSLVGQLLDELSILWLFVVAFAIWLPKKYFPLFLQKDRKRFQIFAFFMGIFGTALACIYPWINSFFLMMLSIPAFISLNFEAKNFNNIRVKKLVFRTNIAFLLSVGCWISDRLFCDAWSALSFPYLHGAWHVFIAITSYTLCVIFAFIDASYSYPHKFPIIRYWPMDTFELGVPYIAFQNIKGDN